MVTGFESFKRWFQGYEKQYIIIGGTACDLIMTEENLPFRATKDIDIVIIVEMLTPEFVSRFWEYVKEAGYEHQNRGTGKPEFYRFSHPRSKEYPAMLELFSRKQELMKLEEGAHLTPLPIKEDISSLSAILLNDAYYELLQSGQIFVEGVPILKPEYIIPFKAKAWLDLRGKKELGEAVDSKDIRKHRNDVFRLSVFLSSEYRVELSDEVKKDMQEFLAAMETENIDLKNLGIAGAKISDLKELLQNCYL